MSIGKLNMESQMGFITHIYYFPSQQKLTKVLFPEHTDYKEKVNLGLPFCNNYKIYIIPNFFLNLKWEM